MPATCAAYILVEAVNIDAAVFDTGQISVIRGGSYLIARAVQTVARHKGLAKGLTALSIGGSSGLLRVGDHLDAADRAHHIARYLRSHSRFNMFPFVVEHGYAPDPATARALLGAKARFRQLRQLTQAPDTGLAGPFDRACALNGRRGAYAERTTTIGENASPLSSSVKRRLWRGRHLRGSMYFDLLHRDGLPDRHAPPAIEALHQRLAGYTFSDSLEQLAHCTRFRVLADKIAVIHMDGNGFGSLQTAFGTSDDKQREFDQAVRGSRARALADVIEAMLPDGQGAGGMLEALIPASEAAKDRPVLRLETLLWGGDEMTLVVPAWLGFDLLFQLYEGLGDTPLAGAAMTHAAGIVFCNAHTPIGRMRELAQQLCESVKAGYDDENPSPNAFDYVVLESIDYPVEKTLGAFFETRYGEFAAQRTALTPPSVWRKELRPALHRLIGDGVLARSQLYRLARSVRFAEKSNQLFGGRDVGPMPWASASDEASTAASIAELSPFEQAEARMIELAGERASRGSVNADLAILANHFGANSGDQRSRAWLWLHLAELWDYLLPERDYKARKVSR